jgi:hypothetical protein
MAILIQHPSGRHFIDLSGPDGNAYFLLGCARNYGRLYGWSKAKMAEVLSEMQDGDYEHLVQTFDKHFGDVCDLVRPDSEEDK